MKLSHHAVKRLFLLLLLVVTLPGLSSCAAEETPQKDEETAQPQEDTVSAGADAPEGSQDGSLPFQAAVSCQPAWSAAVHWYYADEARQETFSLDELCVQEPLEQCIEGLKTGDHDVIVIPWNDDISQELEDYESVPIFKDAIVFIRSNSENNAGWGLTSARIRQAFTEEAAVYWDAEQTDPILPATGYPDMEAETWQLISRLFGFEASEQVLDASGFDNPVQAIAGSGRNGSGLWPYYDSLLGGDMGINGEVIAVDGIFPSGETIGDGSYPYAFSLCAVFSPQNTSYDAVLAFAKELAH